MSEITIRFDETKLGPVSLSYFRDYTATREEEIRLIKELITIIAEQTEEIAMRLYPADPDI